MSKKNLFILIGILLIIGVGGYIYFSTQNNGVVGNNTSSSGGGFSSLFPFFKGTGGGTTGGTTGVQTPQGGSAGETPLVQAGALHQISNRAIAGYFLIKKENPAPTKKLAISTEKESGNLASLPTIRLAERGTGNIYDIDTAGNNEKKISTTPILRTAIALFGNNGTSVLIRYIKNDNQTVASYLGQIKTPSKDENGGEVPGSITGSFLPDNIIDVVVSPDGKNFLYITPTDAGSAGFTIKTDGSGIKQIFQSAFSEWLLQWSPGGIFATTKASSDTAGYVYKISSLGIFNRLIGGIQGLTTLMSPDGKHVLYSTASSRTLSLRIHSFIDGVEIDPGLATLPEKCIWSPGNQNAYCAVPSRLADVLYPDAWYQGIVQFSDSFWKINTVTGETTQIVPVGENDIDATFIQLDPDESYLYFINKTNGTLWSLDLKKN